jgi:hypothetical protein
VISSPQSTEDVSKVTSSNLEAEALGKIPVAGARITVFEPDVYKRPHVFGIQPEASKRTYIVVCDTRDALEDWVATILTLGASYDPTSRTLGDQATGLDMVPASMFSQREGYMWKQGAIPTFPTFKKQFKSRFFVLEHDTLFYYRDRSSADTFYGSVSLINALVELVPLEEAVQTHAQLPPGAVVNGVRNVVALTPEALAGGSSDGARRWIFVCQDEATAAGWVLALQANAKLSSAGNGGSGPPSPEASPRPLLGPPVALSLSNTSAAPLSPAAGSGSVSPQLPTPAASRARGSVLGTVSGLAAAAAADKAAAADRASRSPRPEPIPESSLSALPSRVELTGDDLTAFFARLATPAGAAEALTRGHKNAVTSGWVLRWDDKERVWRRRWLVVSRSTKTLRYWSCPDDIAAQAKPIKASPLLAAECTARSDLVCAHCASVVNLEGSSTVFAVSPLKLTRTGEARLGRTLVFAAPTPALREQWLAVLHDAAAQPDAGAAAGAAAAAAAAAAGGANPDDAAAAAAAAAKAERAQQRRASAKAGGGSGSGAGSPVTPQTQAQTQAQVLSAVDSLTASAAPPAPVSVSVPAPVPEASASTRAARDGGAAAEASVRELKMGAAEALVEDWITLCEGDVIEMLRTLHVIAPHAPHAFADGPDGRAAVVNGDAVRRAYQAALKSVHPDKLATSNTGERVIGEVVFQVLRDAYAVYLAENAD